MRRMPRPLGWTLHTALGLLVGLGTAVALGGPVEALVGMILVTPVLTALVGLPLGLFQGAQLRSTRRAVLWTVATCLGLGAGLAVGVVLIEVVGELITDEPMRLLEQGLVGQVVSFLILGLVAGAVLGLAQRWTLRRELSLGAGWVVRSALGMSLGFVLGALATRLWDGGLASPAGLATLGIVAGLTLGAWTERPVTIKAR